MAWLYVEARQDDGRRVECGPFELAELEKAADQAEKLLLKGYWHPLVVEYELRDGVIKERRFFKLVVAGRRRLLDVTQAVLARRRHQLGF